MHIFVFVCSGSVGVGVHSDTSLQICNGQREKWKLFTMTPNTSTHTHIQLWIQHQYSSTYSALEGRWVSHCDQYKMTKLVQVILSFFFSFSASTSQVQPNPRSQLSTVDQTHCRLFMPSYCVCEHKKYVNVQTLFNPSGHCCCHYSWCLCSLNCGLYSLKNMSCCSEDTSAKGLKHCTLE